MVDVHGYDKIRVASVKGRYLSPDSIQSFLEDPGHLFRREQAGISVEGRPIQKVVLGSGPVRVLMWSQMHGNESTTTKSVLDLLQACRSDCRNAKKMLEKLTLVIIPQLNPDGAKAYTRENAEGVDLNRDAQARTQPESKVLWEVFQTHKPHFCFNLHDQRTIFSAGPGPNPATLSFLSPAADASREVTQSRLTAMKIISVINRELQQVIPGQIGRYDDAFNPNCVGDTFQMQSAPTILVEAGHFPDDYERERTRQFVFHALWTALESIASGNYRDETRAGYESIPENEKKYFDILIRNAQVIASAQRPPFSAGILYREELRTGSIHFRPEIEKEGDLTAYHGHKTYDCLLRADLQRLRSDQGIMALFTEGKRQNPG